MYEEEPSVNMTILSNKQETNGELKTIPCVVVVEWWLVDGATSVDLDGMGAETSIEKTVLSNRVRQKGS